MIKVGIPIHLSTRHVIVMLHNFSTRNDISCIEKRAGGKTEVKDISRKYRNIGHLEEEVFGQIKKMDKRWKGRRVGEGKGGGGLELVQTIATVSPPRPV